MPRKVIREIYDGATSLDLVYNRLLGSKYLDEIIFVIPDNEINQLNLEIGLKSVTIIYGMQLI